MTEPLRGYRHLGELLAEVFDPYLEIIPGTAERRAKVIRLMRMVGTWPKGRNARRQLEKARELTLQQVGRIADLQERQS